MTPEQTVSLVCEMMEAGLSFDGALKWAKETK